MPAAPVGGLPYACVVSISDPPDGVRNNEALVNDVPLVVTPVPDAPAVLIDYGLRYWEHDGLHEHATVAWLQRVADIDPAVSQPNIVAGAGVTATVPGQVCPNCDTTPWTVRSRSDVDGFLKTGEARVQKCGRCDETYRKSVAREMDPERVSRRGAQRQAAEERAAVQRQRAAEQTRARAVRAAWDAARRTFVEMKHPLRFPAAADVPTVLAQLDAPVRVEAAVLAALRFAPAASPIPPLSSWVTPLCPDVKMAASLVEGWLQHGLLAIHPHSALDAFVWEPKTEQALEAAAGDPDLLPEPTSELFYPTEVLWYAPNGPSLGTSPQRLDEYLATRLERAQMTALRQSDLLDLVSEVIAAETLRYFQFQLDEHNLPPVPDNHQVRIEDAAERLGQVRSLSVGYNLAWQSARAAAAAAQANPRAPRPNMTTHGVNMFEDKAQQAVADPTYATKVFRADSRLPLTPLTRLVFMSVLATDPMTTSRYDAANLLPSSLPSGQEEDDDETFNEGYLRLVRLPPRPYDPLLVRGALAHLIDSGDIVETDARQAVTRLMRVYDAVAVTTPDRYAPVVAMLAAANIVTGTVTMSDPWGDKNQTWERPLRTLLHGALAGALSAAWSAGEENVLS